MVAILPATRPAMHTRIVGLLKSSVWRSAAHNLLLIGIWYLLSTILSIYNKKLLGKEHGLKGKGAFPAPLFMSSIQFLLQFSLAKLVFAVRLMTRVKEAPVGWHNYWRIVVPNGILTGIDIGFSNKSLVYITMSFYTMCKSTVPVWLLLCAFIWRIERPNWELAGVVLVISSGLALLVAGETHFDLLGFILVMTAAAGSGIRFTLTQVSLHGHGDAVSMGGPLEVLELLTPVMAITSMVLSLSWEQLWNVLPASPYFADSASMALTLGLIAAGAVIAFLMVWTEYKVIKQTSALTFMIAGTCKEVVTVIAAVLVFHDSFGVVNGVGLVVVIMGVVLFNIHKYRRMIQGHIPVHGQDKHAHKADDPDASATELEPLVVASSGARIASSAPGLSVSVSVNVDRQNGTNGGDKGGIGTPSHLLGSAAKPLQLESVRSLGMDGSFSTHGQVRLVPREHHGIMSPMRTKSASNGREPLLQQHELDP